MTEATKEIRSILASIDGGTILVPGSVVAEVIDFTRPRPYENSPPWLLGELDWSDWSVPVVNFAVLAGTSSKKLAAASNRILILKSLGKSSVTPYLGMPIKGVPSMVKVTSNKLTSPRTMADAPCVFREITLDKKQALIPELDELARVVAESIKSP